MFAGRPCWSGRRDVGRADPRQPLSGRGAGGGRPIRCVGQRRNSAGHRRAEDRQPHPSRLRAGGPDRSPRSRNVRRDSSVRDGVRDESAAARRRRRCCVHPRAGGKTGRGGLPGRHGDPALGSRHGTQSRVAVAAAPRARRRIQAAGPGAAAVAARRAGGCRSRRRTHRRGRRRFARCEWREPRIHRARGLASSLFEAQLATKVGPAAEFLRAI